MNRIFIMVSIENILNTREYICRYSSISKWGNFEIKRENSFDLHACIFILNHDHGRKTIGSIFQNDWKFSITGQILVNSEYLLKYAMDYSLGSSSRSPLDYIQHQIIWWICHDWAKVDNGKKATFVFSDKACPIFCCSLQLDTRHVIFLQCI